MQIITGKTGENHVTSEDDRALNAATFGTGNYLLNVGSKLAVNIETSNNLVISDGEILMNGTHARIRYGETETVVIENGTTGYKRIDLVVARYQKQSGLESVSLAVIKGEATSGTPETPSYTSGNILEGAELAEMPLYAVNLEGVNIVSVTPLFSIITGFDDVYRKDEVSAIQSTLQDNINKAKTSANNAQTAADNAQTSASNALTVANEAINEVVRAHNRITDRASVYALNKTQLTAYSNSITDTNTKAFTDFLITMFESMSAI